MNISLTITIPFLGISFNFINCIILLNIDTLALKVANIRHFDSILEHLLHLGKKCVTMETKNLKYDITGTFLLSIGLCYMLQVFQKF